MAQNSPLSPADLAAIEAAVRQAETRTTGEIYCVVGEESSHYIETPLAWAAGVALLAPAILLLGGVHVSAPELFGGWTAAQVGEAAQAAVRRALLGDILLQAALFAVVGVLVALRPLRLALTPRAVKRHTVRRRAAELFVSKNLHATRERTGVLIFVSLGERMAELMADEGIAAHVEPHVWDRAVAALTEGLKRGEPGAGFAAAVGLCGEVLAERFPADPGDNPNQLPDAVVVLPRH
ncbi:MAG TPA: TPM domain-containing protein [Phenylobacterium sp.]|uniref:TPM domain-containing protein n=1 Tax=Phenylobacterium sp. TaxID=1871053 RepID=UPI002C55E847|nr:TPM domain-containing protein [Phenylobacterium sp.]HSV01633.1 TPM domain-containing protein [Phenylobacterium sp.]